MPHNPLLRPLFGLPLLFLIVLSFIATGCSKDNPTQDAEDYYKRALSYQQQNQYRAAMIEMTNAINADPGAIRYPVAMADIYNELGAGRRASALLERYREHDSRSIALTLARAYLLQGKFLSAEEALEGFTPGSGEEARRHDLYLADAQRLRGNLEQSRIMYDALRREYPGDLEIRLRLVESHIFAGEPERAEPQLEQLRTEHPENADVLRVSAILALQRNNLDRAERFLSQALIYTPDADVMLPERAATLELLSETLTAQGRTAEALVYKKVLAEESPESIAAQQQLRHATSAAEQGNYAEAETILQQLLRENPNSQTAAMMLGMINLSRGNMSEAEPLLTGSVDLETAGSEAIQATALAQIQTGNADQALATLKRSLEAQPDDPVLLSLYGLLALTRPSLEEEGYLSIQKALAQDPHRGALRLALARHHFQRGEDEQGMAQLRSAFKYQPADWDVTNVYMNQLFSRGELKEVASALKTLREAAPKARETALFNAQYRFRSGETQEAIQDMRRMLDAESGYARGHAVIAQMHLEAGNPRQALSSLEQVLALEPDNDRALRAGVHVIQSAGLDQEPQQWLRQLENSQPALRPNATALSAMLYRDAGDLRRAAVTMTTYEGASNDYTRQVSALVYRDRARQLMETGDYAAARKLLGDALEQFPNSMALNLDLVRLDLAEERYDQAALLLEDLRQRYPDDPEVVLTDVRLTESREGREAAFRQLRRAWDRRPSSEMAPALLELARTEAPEAVSDILAQWEEADPENRGRLLYMAEQYQTRGDTAAAIGAYEQLLTNNPDDPIALNNLAWLLKERDLTRALTLAARAAELQPNSAATLDTHGWLLYLSGDRQRALQQLERAVELAPNVDAIRENLETVRQAN